MESNPFSASSVAAPESPHHQPVHDTDPLVHAAFREALLVTGIWLIAGIWSISVCYSMGYNRSVESLKLAYGFPDWIFWGIVVPWVTCTVVSIVFGLLFIHDGDLGQDLENPDDLGLGG